MKDFTISLSSQKELLNLARKSIDFHLKQQKPDFQIKDNELLQNAAVFVTLNKNGQLRGCIGTLEPTLSLYEAVMKMSLEAAFDDSRFFPVEIDELDDIQIEISVLSPMTKITSADEIIQNKHGVLIQQGYRRGLFLPQVWEHFKNKEDFLNELCTQKAGLPKSAWKDGSADIFVFTVFSFEE